MKIRLAILESDQVYLRRILQQFSTKYADKLEVYSFTNEGVVYDELKNSKIDILLASEVFDVDTMRIPDRCGFAYLVDSMDIGTLRDEPAICKFQKAEIIYKHILNIFSENAANITGIPSDGNENGKVLAFLSASGGTGCSTTAAACSIRYAQKGKKVCYLNLEHFGSSDVFFHADGMGNFGDVIYSIKSKKGNLALKLESIVKQDGSGVYFYSSTPVALDMAELNFDEIGNLVTEVKNSGNYDYVIVDLDFSLEKGELRFLNTVSEIILVSDGSDTSNAKLERAITALNILEQQSDMKLLLRSGILYNRFSSKTSSKVQIEDIKEFGGIKRFEGYSTEQLLQQLATLDVFDELA